MRQAGDDAARDGSAPAGWEMLCAEDITNDVVQALDRDDRRKVEDVLSKVPGTLRPLASMFVGNKGSKTYTNFLTRKWVYKLFVLRRW